MKKTDDLLPRILPLVESLPRKEPAVVGVSGGCDSVVLFDLLRRAKFRQLIVAHFHHGLRGATADRDAEFVRQLARKNKTPCVVARGKTRPRARKHRETIEEAARKLRRSFFARTAKKYQAPRIFLAHHSGDVAETLLFHLARGSGPAGLASLRLASPLEGTPATLIRPLVGFTRSEIESYAASRKLDFCEDETNLSRHHTRNRLRHDVLPALSRAIGFDPVPALVRAAEILAAENDWIEELVADDARSVELDKRSLRAMPLARQRRLLRAWLRLHAKIEPNFATVECVRHMALSITGPAKMNVPQGRHVRRREGKIFLEPAV
jgi:tRNA(Ile)-lysidine synthase